MCSEPAPGLEGSAADGLVFLTHLVEAALRGEDGDVSVEACV